MVRCKVRCSVLNRESGKVVLHPVWDSNPASPNHRWSSATPSGDITLYITNARAIEQFAEGQHYFVDLEPCAADAIDKTPPLEEPPQTIGHTIVARHHNDATWPLQPRYQAMADEIDAEIAKQAGELAPA